MGRLRYKGYVGTVEYDEEDGSLTGKVLGLRRDGILYEGSSVKEITEDFHQAVDHYLQTCKDLGIKPERPYSGKLVLRITPTLHGQAAEKASTIGVSLNEWISQAIQNYLS